MPSLRRLVEIWKTEGITALGTKIARYGVVELRDAYWMGRRTRTLTQPGATATFSTKTRQDARDVRRLPTLEAPMLGDFLSALTPTDVVYDVGAYTGLYAASQQISSLIQTWLFSSQIHITCLVSGGTWSSMISPHVSLRSRLQTHPDVFHLIIQRSINASGKRKGRLRLLPRQIV